VTRPRASVAATVAVVVLAAALQGVLLWRTRPLPFGYPGSAVGGGIVEVDTGRLLESTKGGEFSDGSVTVIPFRAGGRYRIPVLVEVPEHAEADLLDVRAVLGPGSAARAEGAVYAEHCCVLDDVAPLRALALPRGRFHDPTVLVGVELVLCCPPPLGWVERVPGVRITYRHHGRVRTAYQPFSEIQQVVIRG
jgi:hypothetical protein